MALGGQTPAEAVGLDLQLSRNTWKQLIQRSTLPNE
jgi:hypothetical protein